MPRRPPGHALLKTLVAGICNTDLELQRGYYGFAGTPGHEFVAEVVECDRAELLGRRVVGEINLPCTHCPWCCRGMGRHCPERTVLGIVKHPGAFQEFFTLPERNLHVLPDGLTNGVAVFAEPLAAACEILDQVEIPRHEPIAVLGDGKLGLLISMLLAAHGYPVRQFGRHADKLRIAEREGVAVELIEGPLPVAAFGWAVDATGNPAGLHSAISLVWPRGTVILKSTVHGSVPTDTVPAIVHEITLVGSRCGRMEEALPLLEHGIIPVERMIAARYRMAQASEAFEHAARKGTLKVLLAG